MTKVTTTIQFDQPVGVTEAFQEAAQSAFAQVAGELTGRFDAAVSGAHWPWPDETPRFGGARDLRTAADNWNTWLTGSGTGAAPKSVAGSPRSIVDSGNLKQSRDFNLYRTEMKAEWNWNVDYAAAVHEGAYIHPFNNPSKLVQIPARPWTQAVLEGGTTAQGIPVYPVAANLKKFLQQRLS